MEKNLCTKKDTQPRSLGQEDPVEKGIATHSNYLAWRIPWTEKLGRLQSMGLQRLRHDWATNPSLHFMGFEGLPWWLSSKESACQCRRYGLIPGSGKVPWRREWQPTPVFLLGKFHGQRRLVGYSPRDHKEWGMTERLNNNNRQTLKTRSSPRPCSHRCGSWGHSVHSELWSRLLLELGWQPHLAPVVPTASVEQTRLPLNGAILSCQHHHHHRHRVSCV